MDKYSRENTAPIILVGAGRSGTKLLRSVLAVHSDTVCFPREINYIWRHGNANFPTDELRQVHARPEVAQYIQGQFERLSDKNNGRRVIEKTCANSLRVEFVHNIFPEAVFVHLVRDGRAVAESSQRRWLARPELGYLWEKLRWVPVGDIPNYALRFLRYQIGRLYSNNGFQSSWGPRFEGLDEIAAEKTLIEVCGLQWKACVQVADAALSCLPSQQVVKVHYEALIEDPASVANDLFSRLELPFTDENRQYIEQMVHAGNLDKWKQALSTEDLDLLLPHIESEMLRQGYCVG